MEFFNEEICEHLGNYVYRLIDPRNEEVFYVGKGKNNRVFQHIKNVILDPDEDDVSLKTDRIRSIQQAGLEVTHLIHRHGISDSAIFEVEAALIDVYPQLDNIQGGHGSSERGPMSTNELRAKYGLKETVRIPGHKLLLINLNRSSEDMGRADFYEKVRFAWKINSKQAAASDYVLAVLRGVVRDVFVAEKWFKATKENFPQLPVDMPARLGFVGYRASQEIIEQYVNTRLPANRTHIQNPIRYWYTD